VGELITGTCGGELQMSNFSFMHSFRPSKMEVKVNWLIIALKVEPNLETYCLVQVVVSGVPCLK